MNRAASILLVEDDASFGYILKEYLALHGFEVWWLKDGAEALRSIRQTRYDLCILDIMLPGADGFEIARALKASSAATPFIFLTARSLKVDKLKGFQQGCDDYEVKPVDEELLLAKIHAILNRSGRSSHAMPEQTVYSIGAYTFDAANHTLRWKEEMQLLTEKETALLALFCAHQNRLLERSRVLKDVWGVADLFSRKSMDVFVTRLRKYFAKDPSVKIINIHSKGFIFHVPPAS
jgi:DNA-binding response OmpR family regulator